MQKKRHSLWGGRFSAAPDAFMQEFGASIDVDIRLLEVDIDDALGDLACDDRSVRRARVFGDEGRTVAVIYTGEPDGRAIVRLGLPVLKLEGIDGRALEAAADGAVPVPDGLVYAWLDRAKLAARLQTDTVAMRLTKMAIQKGR